jgi:hypothetical protein
METSRALPMKQRLTYLLAIAVALAPSVQAQKSAPLPVVQTSADLKPASGAIVFAYFKEPGNQGIYFALSRDGYTFTPLNDGEPWLKPTEPGEIMRDVFITRNPSGSGFRAVWAPPPRLTSSTGRGRPKFPS